MRSHSSRARRQMRRLLGIGIGAAIGFSAQAAFAGSCGDLRSFVGTVREAGGKHLMVERGGNASRFTRASDSVVTDEAGSGVASWSGLRAGMRVKVCWAFEDSPRAARRVFIMTSR